MSTPQQEVYSGQIVNGLLHALRAGESGLNQVPLLVKRVIEDAMWRNFTVERTGQVVNHLRFIDFVATKPLEGLGADIDLLKRICADHVDVIDLIDREVKGRSGERTDLVNIVNEVYDNPERPTGNARAHALRKLRKDRPDLHSKVINKELSPHGAMVEAGFRPKTMTVPAEPEAAARALRKVFNATDLARLASLITAPQANE